jgi:hypothetical protein
MTHVTVPATSPLITYPVTTAQTVFTIPAYIVFWSEDDLRVAIDGVDLADTGWSVVGVDAGGGYTGGTLTLAVAVSNCSLALYRSTELGRSTDFVEGAPITRQELNTQFDKLAAADVDAYWRNQRTLRAADWMPPLNPLSDPLNPAAILQTPATAPQARAGTDNAAYMTALRTAQAMSSVKATGAIGNGVANDAPAFSSAAAAGATVRVPSGTYLLNTNPTAATYIVDDGASFTGAGNLNTVTGHVVSHVGAFRSIESDSSFYSGIFGYLEQNAAISGYGTIGIHGAARSSGGTGGASEVDIGIAAFALHDLAASTGSVCAIYGTAVRQSGVNGATHALEIDVANMGGTVQLFPHAMFPAGATQAAWFCSGGEITAAGGSPGTASCAIGIVQNDSQAVKTANFDKGIIFHNTAIAGADGTGGIGVAMAFAVGHASQWFNNSAQVVAEIVSTATTQAACNYRLDFSPFGVLLQDRGTGVTALQIEKTVNAANGLAMRPNTTGGAPALAAIGTDTNVDLRLLGKGTGVIRFGTWTSSADAPVDGYITVRDEATGTLRKVATIA